MTDFALSKVESILTGSECYVHFILIKVNIWRIFLWKCHFCRPLTGYHFLCIQQHNWPVTEMTRFTFTGTEQINSIFPIQHSLNANFISTDTRINRIFFLHIWTRMNQISETICMRNRARNLCCDTTSRKSVSVFRTFGRDCFPVWNA